MVFESFFGETLVMNDGTEMKTSELSTEKGAVIGIYFSAHWCPPCRGFTPKLATIYNEIKEAGKDFEIVFVSWDNDDESFKEYHAEQPWLAIPYSNNEAKNALGEKYQVRGIPNLVLLEAGTGNTISTEGRAVVTEYGAAGFPFTPERLAEAKKEIKEKKEAALKELGDLKCLGKLGSKDEPDKELDISEIRKSEAVAIAFMDGPDCQGSCLVLPKLLEIQQKMGNEKLNSIVVPMMKNDDEDFPEESLSKMKDVPMIPRGERAQAVIDTFKPILKEIEAPRVFVIDVRDESSMKILAEDAAQAIYFHGEAAYPWSDEAIKAMKDKAEALKQEMRGKQKNLEFFSPSENCHIVNKEGAEVSLSILQSKDVVGIYFSAHWCGPCRAFTPKLVELYNGCKEQGKSFEIVFISSDSDQAAFDEYYGEMPWCALKYSDRALKEALSEVFEVVGIPTLILLKGDGELVLDDNLSGTVVESGAAYFPWTPEDIKHMKADEEEVMARKLAEKEEEEEKGYAEQKDSGKIVIRRHKGDMEDVTIGVDHSVKFGSFTTVAAPSAVVPTGKKSWYEVTFMEGDGISQVGWANGEFSTCDSYTGSGVGDDSNSWGFDGQRVCKWFDGSTKWGKEFKEDRGHVLGVAADMENGKILFGLDGDWSEPMGTAFEDLDRNLKLFPALTAQGMKVSVNFGDRDMKFGPPDESFEKVFDVVEK